VNSVGHGILSFILQQGGGAKLGIVRDGSVLLSEKFCASLRLGFSLSFMILSSHPISLVSLRIQILHARDRGVLVMGCQDTVMAASLSQSDNVCHA